MKRWTDEELLEMMQLHENEGSNIRDMALLFKTTMSSVNNQIVRIRRETKAHFPPCDADGSMPQRWWKR